MSNIFAVRNLDKKTIEYIKNYANNHNLNTAEAIRDLIFFGLKHIQKTQKKKKYNSIFEVYDKLKFRGESNLSENIDEIVYGR